MHIVYSVERSKMYCRTLNLRTSTSVKRIIFVRYILSLFILGSAVSSASSSSDYFTSPVANHIASLAEITVSSHCSGDHGGITCNTSCPYRSGFPTLYDKHLNSKSANCYNASYLNELPTAGVPANGNIAFQSGSNCTHVNFTSFSGDFTFTTWLRVSSSYNWHLLTTEDGSLNITIDGNVLKVNGSTVAGILEAEKWTHLAIRNQANVEVFINGKKEYSGSRVTSASQLVTLGPNADLGGIERLDMADARWYREVLTDREIGKLWNDHFENLLLLSECRCPGTYPTVQRTGNVQSDLYCINKNGSTVLRLNTDYRAYPYMVDGDNSTFWASGYQRNASVQIHLHKTVQMTRIVLHGLRNSSDLPRIRLNETYYSSKRSGLSAIIDFEDTFSEWNRRAYEVLLSDRIDILFESTIETVFTVSEIEIQARCACYGNDPGCSISTTTIDYNCSCSQSTNTSGPNCETCRDEFYRLSDDRTCPYPCDCNPHGRKNNNCSKVEGQCDCKSNVNPTIRACDTCMPNTANITSNPTTGCTACTCNPTGITSCSNDFSCRCKANVEMNTGTCSKCLTNYYGITNTDGCVECGCNDAGTNNTEPRICDMTTGQCPCKLYVQGRTCNECKDKFFKLDKRLPFGCEDCNCNAIGRENEICDKTTGKCNCRQPVTGNRDCHPAKLRLEPDYGPRAGGTVITIFGELLGDDSVTVWLTLVDTWELKTDRNDTLIQTRTKRHTKIGKENITIVWTKGNVPSKDESLKFTYKENPTVTPPMENQPVKTFASGGCDVDIYGTNLDSVPQPELLVYTENRNFSMPCSHQGSSRITCQTPNFKENMSSETNAAYGVGLDNIRDYNRFTAGLLIIPDPSVTTSEPTKFRNTFDDKIKIKGNGLNKACRDSDVRVMIGNVTCTLISRTDTEIMCEPEDGFPGESGTATVMLYIGNFKAEAGNIEFLSFWKTTEFYIIVGSVGGGVLIIIIIIVTVLVCRRRRNQNTKTTFDTIEMTSDPDRNHSSNQYVLMEPGKGNPVATVPPLQASLNHTEAFIKRLPTNVAKAVKTSVIDKQQLEVGRLCTKKGGMIRIINGQFSTSSSSVFAGNPLTIKTLIDPYDEEGTLPSWLTVSLLECTRLRDCHNTHVLPLLGITIDDKHVYILYPEMSNRSLKDYMNASPRIFNEKKRLDVCKQVAEGMNFLDAQHIVHKDLASRNCWVDSSETVKIGDASFSWDLYPEEYLLQNDRYQPVRWLAPESLRQPGFYSSKTDVWSYGVFMWEVFTNGYLPYHDIEDDTQIRECVCEKGYRLGKPLDCSDIIYKVLEICHTENSQDRPNFFIIVNHLSEIIAGGNPTIFNVDQQTSQVDDADEVDYMNMNFEKMKPRRR